jgi:hypothetical protein
MTGNNMGTASQDLTNHQSRVDEEAFFDESVALKIEIIILELLHCGKFWFDDKHNINLFDVTEEAYASNKNFDELTVDLILNDDKSMALENLRCALRDAAEELLTTTYLSAVEQYVRDEESQEEYLDMSAKDKPVSKPNNKAFEDNFDRFFGEKPPVGEDLRPKDRVKLGISPSAEVMELEK